MELKKKVKNTHTLSHISITAETKKKLKIERQRKTGQHQEQRVKEDKKTTTNNQQLHHNVEEPTVTMSTFHSSE